MFLSTKDSASFFELGVNPRTSSGIFWQDLRAYSGVGNVECSEAFEDYRILGEFPPF